MSKIRSCLMAAAPAIAVALSGCAGNPSVPSLTQNTGTQGSASLQSSSLQGQGLRPASTATLSKNVHPDSPTENVIYSFGAYAGDAEVPDSPLALDSSGAYYGTSQDGGSNGNGAVFKLTPGGNGFMETTLFSFSNYSDGYSSQGVIVDSSGALYGVTQSGGNSSCYCGTIFKLTPGASGYTESILHTFQGGSDGANPYGQLTLDANGNVYGTTNGGGLSSDGTIFELSPSGSSYQYKQIYAFQGAPNDGSGPQAGLLLASNGTFYGTTFSGGKHYEGMVYALTPSGSGGFAETPVYSFNGPKKDLADPASPLIQDGSGNIFGTTYGGGAKYYGGVYKLTPSGPAFKESVIYSFKGGKKDGRYVRTGVAIDPSGNLFGTDYQGGLKYYGFVYELSPTGSKNYKEAILINFADAFGGGYPEGGVSVSAGGTLFGTTSSGGAQGDGNFFSVVI